MLCPNCNKEASERTPDYSDEIWVFCPDCGSVKTDIDNPNFKIPAKIKFKSPEECRKELEDKGYVKTKVFGWVKKRELEWLNKNLEEVHFGKTVEELDGIPSYEIEIGEPGKKKKVTMVYDFIETFYKIRNAEDRISESLIQSELL